MLKADHDGVARFGESEKDQGNLEKVLSSFKGLYDHALKAGMSRMISSVPLLTEGESNQEGTFEARLNALRN